MPAIHCDLFTTECPIHLQIRRSVNQETRCVELCTHVRKIGSDLLLFDDRFAKLNASLRSVNASSIARRVRPSAPPTVVRKTSSVCIAILKPCPSSPSNWLCRIRQSLNRKVPIGCSAITSKGSISSPSVSASTMKAEIPRRPASSWS